MVQDVEQMKGLDGVALTLRRIAGHGNNIISTRASEWFGQ